MRILNLTRILGALALVSLGSASVLYRLNDGTKTSSGSLFLATRDEPLPPNSPLCVPACTSLSCGGTDFCAVGDPQGEVTKRGLGLDWASFFNNASNPDGTLNKRLFTYNAGSRKNADYTGDTRPTEEQADAYLPAVASGNDKVNFGNRLATVNGGDERAVSKERRFKDSAFQIVTSGVYGCTVVVLVSNRAVWAAHFWEIYSNNQAPDGLGDDIPNDPAFDDRVLKFLRGEKVIVPKPGAGNYITPGGPSPSKDLYNNKDTDETTLYIFTPVEWQAEKSLDNLRFKNHYGPEGEVVKTINTLLDIEPMVEIVPYSRINFRTEEHLLDETSHGHVVFQFDPNSDGKKKRAWRLFLENRFEYKELPAAS